MIFPITEHVAVVDYLCRVDYRNHDILKLVVSLSNKLAY